MTINSNILPDRIVSNADLSELQAIREFVGAKAEDFGFDKATAFNIALAVDEACSNLIRHAYKLDASKEFSVEVEKNSNLFTVVIYDWGIPFNPMNKELQDMDEYLRSYKSGGLGIHIIRKIMDAIEYRPAIAKDQPNALSLIKQL